MRCKLFPVHLAVIIFSVCQSQPLAAVAAGAPFRQWEVPLWCSSDVLGDVIDNSKACQPGNGVDCWAPLDAFIRLCIDEAEALDLSPVNLLKRNRNTFLGKRSSEKRDGSRNTFLGKREDFERFRKARNTFLGKRLATENDIKRSRNRFLGKRTSTGGLEFESTSTEKRSRNKHDQFEDLKRSRQPEIKRSRNKFLG